MKCNFLKPVCGHVLLVDGNRDEEVVGGIVVVRQTESPRMDFTVAGVGDGVDGFGKGDRVIVSDPYAGRRVTLDGAPYRIVRAEEVVAVVEG